MREDRATPIPDNTDGSHAVPGRTDAAPDGDSNDKIHSDLMFGLAPSDAQDNDRVCILAGCTVPVLLRPQGDHYRLIGETFIYGKMDGEAMPDLSEDDLFDELCEFNII